MGLGKFESFYATVLVQSACFIVLTALIQTLTIILGTLLLLNIYLFNKSMKSFFVLDTLNFLPNL